VAVKANTPGGCVRLLGASHGKRRGRQPKGRRAELQQIALLLDERD